MALGELALEDINVKRTPKQNTSGRNSRILVEDNSSNVNVISDTSGTNESTTVISLDLPDIIPLQRNCVDTKPFSEYFEEGVLPENEKRGTQACD